MTYGLTIIFFSYMLEKQLSAVFYPRLLATVFFGISIGTDITNVTDVWVPT
jgi:hypothetical protein